MPVYNKTLNKTSMKFHPILNLDGKLKTLEEASQVRKKKMTVHACSEDSDITCKE